MRNVRFVTRYVFASALISGGLVFAAGPTFAQQQPNLVTLSRDQNQWVMAPHDYANTRFSGLDQINAGNVGQLQLAWTFSVGADRGQEAAPLIVNNVMYVVAPYAGPHPNQVFALDATTGEL